MDTLNDFVLVVPDEKAEELTPAGLVLVGSASNPIVSGVIYKVPDVVIMPYVGGFEHQLEAGDRVFFTKRDANHRPFNLDGRSVILLRFGELIGYETA